MGWGLLELFYCSMAVEWKSVALVWFSVVLCTGEQVNIWEADVCDTSNLVQESCCTL